MKRYILFLAAILIMNSCRQIAPEKPLWIYGQDSIIMPGNEVLFETVIEEWEATLFTPTQPVELMVSYSQGQLKVQSPKGNGWTEGRGRLVLSLKENYFVYPVYIKNQEPATIDKKDYRSAKSIHVDSSHFQQSIKHHVDTFRNLQLMDNGLYFLEKDLRISPKAGTYRADPGKSLSSYYVFPGKSNQIPLSYNYVKEDDRFDITTAVLNDRYGNQLPDGTVITFVYTQSGQSFRAEKTLLDGKAHFSLPAIQESVSLYATLDDIISETLKISKK